MNSSKYKFLYSFIHHTLGSVSQEHSHPRKYIKIKNTKFSWIGAKIMYINELQKYIVIQTPDNKHSKKS